MKSSRKIEHTIEMAHGSYWYCQRGTYERSSVLAGQDFRQLVEPFETLEAAKAAHPEARVDLEGCRPEVRIPSVAPSWFDPSACGERWDEDY